MTQRLAMTIKPKRSHCRRVRRARGIGLGTASAAPVASGEAGARATASALRPRVEKRPGHVLHDGCREDWPQLGQAGGVVLNTVGEHDPQRRLDVLDIGLRTGHHEDGLHVRNGKALGGQVPPHRIALKTDAPGQVGARRLKPPLELRIIHWSPLAR